ncbi:MAG: pyruvate, water dikinase regulatory protein [Peptoanaerobacter stomatis]
MDTLNIFILSDSLGNTAEHVVKAAMSQFEANDFVMRKFSYITDVSMLGNIFEEIKSQKKAIILYTIVHKQIISEIKNFASRENIKEIDLLSPIVSSIQGITGLVPLEKTGMLRKLNDLYFKRVESIEFAVKYDDGKDPRGVLKADLVILGISRTSKTPLSMYLANKNIKVANIPLVPESTPPKEIYQVPAQKIIGLTNSPEKLNEIRTERLNALGLPTGSSYADMNRILEEIDYAEKIMKKIGCPVINVANKAIEETAEIVISYLKRNGVKIDNEII